jgi:hypothetical protein
MKINKSLLLVTAAFAGLVGGTVVRAESNEFDPIGIGCAEARGHGFEGWNLSERRIPEPLRLGRGV